MTTLKHRNNIAVNTSRLRVSSIKRRLKPVSVNKKTVPAAKQAHNKGAKSIKASKNVHTNKNRAVSKKKYTFKQKPRSHDVITKRYKRRQPAVSRRVRRSRSRQVDPDAIGKLRGVGRGKVLIIVANGPSHKEADLPKLKGIDNIDIMSINKPDDRIWPTDYWLFCDNSQHRRHSELWDAYKGIIINSSAIRKVKPQSVKIQTLPSDGFSVNMLKGIHVGRSSTYAALQVAIYMDYDHIYVFGCDMCRVDGKLYSWGSNPDVPDGSREKRFKRESRSFAWLANNIQKRILDKISFCTKYNKWNFIDSFEKLDHSEAIDIILDRYGDDNEQKDQISQGK